MFVKFGTQTTENASKWKRLIIIKTACRKRSLKPAGRSENGRVPFFIVEKSAVMVYNKLLNFAGVAADYSDSWFRERDAYEKREKT